MSPSLARGEEDKNRSILVRGLVVITVAVAKTGSNDGKPGNWLASLKKTAQLKIVKMPIVGQTLETFLPPLPGLPVLIAIMQPVNISQARSGDR